MRVRLIVNPAASSVSARRTVRVRQALSALHEVDVAMTHRRDHATILALDAARAGLDAVVVFGGDGTLNEAANGVADSMCALAPLPGGSTNVFARTLGLPDEPVAAAEIMARSIGPDATHRVGTGSMNGRRFLFHTGIGWDARLVREVERHGQIKRFAGHALFVQAGLRTWFRLWDRTTPHFAVTFEDGTTASGGFALVMNTDPYTFVGSRPFRVAPDATLDRPLVVVSLRDLRSLPFVGLIGRSLSRPDAMTRSALVDYRADVESVTVRALRSPIPVQVDGDDVGDLDHIEFRHHPRSLSLVIPPGPIGRQARLGHS